MTIASKQEPLILLIGDIFFFLIALFLTLFIRYAEVPGEDLFYNHLAPFSVLFVVWIIVYAISGLYEKHTTLLRSRLPSLILNVQAINIALAALFFFFIPYFGIAPKTNLVLYLIISSLLILVWRLYFFPRLGFHRRQKAILIGYRDEVQELVEEVNANPRYHLEFVLIAEVDRHNDESALKREIREIVSSGAVSVVVADIRSGKTESLLTTLYERAFQEEPLVFLDIHKVYESVFDRIPMSALNERWILENIPSGPQKLLYDVCKRIMDIVGALLLGAILLVFLPFVAAVIKLEDRGPVFLRQQRIGRHGNPIFVYKFRTMRFSDSGDAWVSEKGTNTVTRIGKLLRKGSIDEFPQCLNVLKGELSLIGPRSDISGIHERLTHELPYNDLRYVVTPGISGWAQIKQQYEEGHVNPQSISEMRMRLSYDLFYIKNRSLILDVIIAVRTLKALFSGRAGI